MGEFKGGHAPGFQRPRLSKADIPSTTPNHSLFDSECQEKASIRPKAQSRMPDLRQHLCKVGISVVSSATAHWIPAEAGMTNRIPEAWSSNFAQTLNLRQRVQKSCVRPSIQRRRSGRMFLLMPVLEEFGDYQLESRSGNILGDNVEDSTRI